MKARSLSFRLLLSTSLILVAFFAIVAWVLEKGFRESAEQAQKEQLMIQVYALLSAVDLTPAGTLHMPESLPESRFSNPGSGLYGIVWLPNRQLIWRSSSAIDIDLQFPPQLKPGFTAFLQDNSGMFVVHYRVIWETEKKQEKEYIFSVAEDSKFVINQVSGFRDTLRIWLAAIGLVLLVIQFIVLRWSLKPLRTIGNDLTQIEQGKKSRLEGVYPAELQGLADNLNGLISSERGHLKRYRNTLADLAHSLKTPLAIVRGCLEIRNTQTEMDNTLQTEISRMDDIVEYHLQRAAAKGKNKKFGNIDAGVILHKIILSLEKVYADKDLTIHADFVNVSRLNCETGDFYEIAGNLIDNACKWCQHQVRVTLQASLNKHYSIVLFIEDDGQGIDPEQLGRLLQRGIRADENIHGHGIGLAVVQELIILLNGRLKCQKSELLGGMKWVVFLP